MLVELDQTYVDECHIRDTSLCTKGEKGKTQGHTRVGVAEGTWIRDVFDLSLSALVNWSVVIVTRNVHSFALRAW